MGLFDKKFCDVCGDKIGFLGNRKLEDANLCKNCAAKLSPWFDDRRHSTLEEIKAQLAYREANQEEANAFHVSRTFGEGVKVLLLDEDTNKFAVAGMKSMPSGNPDIINCVDITNISIDPKEHKKEIKYKNSEGKEVSYNPKRYEYSYDFCCKIQVNHPYFSEMYFDLNESSVTPKQTAPVGVGLGGMLNDPGVGQTAPPTDSPEFKKYIEIGNELKDELMKRRRPEQTVIAEETESPAAPEDAAEPETAGQTDPAPSASWFCPGCGAKNEGMFCVYCGIKKPEF